MKETQEIVVNIHCKVADQGYYRPKVKAVVSVTSFVLYSLYTNVLSETVHILN